MNEVLWGLFVSVIVIIVGCNIDLILQDLKAKWLQDIKAELRKSKD